MSQEANVPQTGRLFSHDEVNAALDGAINLITPEPFGADTGLARAVANDTAAHLKGPGPFTYDEVNAAANAAAEEILDDEYFEVEYSNTIRDRSMVDLAVNVIGHLLSYPDDSLDDAIEASWQAEEEDETAAEMVRGWLA